MKSSCFVFIFYLIFCCSNESTAQNPLLKHFTTNDGLSSSTIYRMIQDKNGFIWLATDVGVTRFDGKKFENYTELDGLSDNEILALKQDSKGRIWFLGFNGTVSYWLNGKIYNSTTDTILKQVVTSTSFIDFFEDNQKRLWFISQSENTIIENNKVIKPSREVLPSAYILLNTNVGQLIISSECSRQFLYQNGVISTIEKKHQLRRGNNYCILNDGSVIFPSMEGLVLQKDTSQTLLIPFDDYLKKSPQLGIQLTNNNLLWMTTVNGVYCYNYNDLKAPPVIYLKNNMPCNLLADNEGNIWISTFDVGLFMIPAWGLKIKLFYDGHGLTNNQCFSTCKTKKGEIIVGLNKGKVAVILNNKIVNFGNSLWENVDRVHHLISYKDKIWIGSDSKFMYIDRTKNKITPIYLKNNKGDLQFITAVKDISISQNKDTIYIAKNYYVLAYAITNKKADKKQDYAKILVQSDTRIYSSYSSFSGKLWYGAKDGLMSIKNNNVVSHANENILLTKRINSMSETEDSVLVIATHGFGILFYKNGKIINQLTVNSGLCSDICRRIYIYKNKIYVATPAGVSIIFYSKNNQPKIINLNSGNFLHFNDINDIYVDNKELCIATMNGLVTIKQEAIEITKQIIPRLEIKSITAGNILVNDSQNINLSYKQNAISLNFIGIYYQVPDEVNYEYRLKDNELWTTTKNTVLDFPYLINGAYHFQLRARIKNGQWSSIKSFRFTINPPFWKTNWFLLSAAIFFVFIVYIILKIILKKSREKTEEKEKIEKQITSLEQNALQTIMNPHFVFNVMNSIQHFINANDKKLANQYLVDFAKLIRMNLTISYKKYITLEEEINYLLLYLSFEKLRFGNGLNYEIIVDEEIDVSKLSIAVMMIQPFVENAIWHGILPMGSEGFITINIAKELNDLLKITIIDNGVGIEDKYIENNLQIQKNESHALSIVFQRLILLSKFSGNELYVKFSHLNYNHKNKGTILEMHLPAQLS